MRPSRVSDADLIAALDLEDLHGSAHLARLAGATDAPEATIRNRARTARINGLKPSVRKEAPRIHTRERLGRMHIVIPDVQCKPGVSLDHLEWVGNYIAEKRPIYVTKDGKGQPHLALFA